MTRHRAAVLVGALLLLGSTTVAAPTGPTDPIVTGRLDYRVSWNGIPAGDATVRIARLDGGVEPQYRVEAAVRTTWLVDLLWSLRAKVFANFTTVDLTPLGFRYDRDVNREHSLTDVVFDPSTLQATGIRVRGAETKTLRADDPAVLDPITAIFRALARPLSSGDTFRYEVFTGEARYRVELRVVGEDTVHVDAGTFRAWRVEPQVWKLGTGVDRRLRHATLWVSAGPVHTLLRIRSDVFVGAVNCDLQRLGT